MDMFPVSRGFFACLQSWIQKRSTRQGTRIEAAEKGDIKTESRQRMKPKKFLNEFEWLDKISKDTLMLVSERQMLKL